MEAEFSFHVEIEGYHIDRFDRIGKWLNEVTREEKQKVKTINYIFCSDDYLLELNKQYLDHDYYTDILSFPLNEDPVEGDIFISLDRVKDNAGHYNVAFDRELNRVIVHGLLHFLGYDDHTENDSKIMRRKEDQYLALYPEAE